MISALAFGLVYLALIDSFDTIPYFFSIGIVTIFALHAWLRNGLSSIPLLPVFILQQSIIYSLPMVVQDEAFLKTSERTLLSSSFAICLFILALIGGWSYGKTIVKRPPPSRFVLLSSHLKRDRTRILQVGLSLLLFGFLFNIFNRTGLLHAILPDEFIGLLAILRAGADASTLLGATISGMFLALKPKDIWTWSFALLVIANIGFSLIDFRLAAASTIIISTAAGLSLAKRRVPWVFLISAFLIFGFLNQSKFIMRDRYWEGDATWVDVPLKEIPKLYREWFSTSAKMFTGNGDSFKKSIVAKTSSVDSGQSIIERIDNLQNLIWAVDAVQEKNIPVLNGKTYLLVPKLLFPRFLWKDKPRVHEGQVLLNLHFQRQFSVKQTERTYIAWGALPEAVGNFGIVFGPALIGLLIGIFLGLIEKISIHQRFFSIEGLLLIGFLLKMGVSHEMVASVFITSFFQFSVLIIAAGMAFRIWIGPTDAAAAYAYPSSRKKRESESENAPLTNPAQKSTPTTRPWPPTNDG